MGTCVNGLEFSVLSTSVSKFRNTSSDGVLVGQIAIKFLKRWLSDYLPEITRRTKWYTDTKPISIDDVVVIADPNLPRSCWPKGKIIATHSSKDGKIRSATVRTLNGVYERPVAKLAILDVRCGDKQAN